MNKLFNYKSCPKKTFAHARYILKVYVNNASVQ